MLMTQNFTWLTCTECGKKIGVRPGEKYESSHFICECEKKEDNGTTKRGRPAKAKG